MTDAPIILIEVGLKAEGMASNVLITKDDGITSITIPWDEPETIDEAFIDSALEVLAPIRYDHPRFTSVVLRLLMRKRQLHEAVNGS